MHFLGQDHSDGHPLMPQHGAEPSLSPPLGGTSVFAMAHDILRRFCQRGTRRPHEGLKRQGNSTKKRGQPVWTLWWWWWWWLLLLLLLTLTHVSVHTRKILKTEQDLQLINAQLEACHLGVQLPASAPPPKPSMTKNSSSQRGSQLRKLALNSGTTGGARKMSQNAQKKPSLPPNASKTAAFPDWTVWTIQACRCTTTDKSQPIQERHLANLSL